MITNRNLIVLVGAVLLVICVWQISASNINENCITPKEELGICIPIAQCELLKNLLLQRPVQSSNIKFLRRSQCGNHYRVVLVCCPKVDAGPKVDDGPIAQKKLLPEPGVCGKLMSDRIYGGTETKIDEHAWMALIAYKKSRNRIGFHCGGSLINEKYVLTAAHCIKAIPRSWSLMSVRLGEWDLEQTPDCQTDSLGHTDCAPPHVDVDIEKTIVHENYKSSDMNQLHDIALLRLAHVVAFTDFIQPICLPFDEHLRAEQFFEHRMNIVGWGKTEKATMSTKKLKANVPVVSLEDCKEVYAESNVAISRPHICAGGKVGMDSCRGDSGGPLIGQFQSNRSKPYYFIAGIISFGPSPCGSIGWPGVYTRVSEYVDWIQNNILP